MDQNNQNNQNPFVDLGPAMPDALNQFNFALQALQKHNIENQLQLNLGDELYRQKLGRINDFLPQDRQKQHEQPAHQPAFGQIRIEQVPPPIFMEMRPQHQFPQNPLFFMAPQAASAPMEQEEAAPPPPAQFGQGGNPGIPNTFGNFFPFPPQPPNPQSVLPPPVAAPVPMQQEPQQQAAPGPNRVPTIDPSFFDAMRPPPERFEFQNPLALLGPVFDNFFQDGFPGRPLLQAQGPQEDVAPVDEQVIEDEQIDKDEQFHEKIVEAEQVDFAQVEAEQQIANLRNLADLGQIGQGPEPVSIEEEPQADSPEVDVVQVSPGEPPAVVTDEMEYDEGHDDVDEMFDLSEMHVRRSPEREFSPIQYTPPSHDEDALGDIFGLDEEAPQASTPSTASRHDDPYAKPANNIPIYKQNGELSMEAQEAQKKKDPDYDPFEFTDDEEVSRRASLESKNSPKKEKKIEQPKHVYVRGTGFEFLGGPAKQPKPIPNPVDMNKITNLVTLADQIQNQRDSEMTSSFIKHTQIRSSECAKNQRVATKEEPLLPKFVVKLKKVSQKISKSQKRKEKMYSIKQVERSYKPNLIFITDPSYNEADKIRVSAFGPAEGAVKGDYLVNRSDILSENCPIYKVDGVDILQKLVPNTKRGSKRIVYENILQYSGWCQEVAHKYFRISANVIKQFRFDVTVEPVIPLSELFCASSIESFRHPGIFKNPDSGSEVVEVTGENVTDERQIALNTLLQACLSQVFSKNHIQKLREKKNFEFSHALDRIELHNQECETMILNRIPIRIEIKKWIGTYTRLVITETSYHTRTACQVCQHKISTRILQFFDDTFYDLNLQMEIDSKPDQSNPLVVTIFACATCSKGIESLHGMHHLKFHMLRSCQAKLEEIGTRQIELSADALVRDAKADKGWMESIIQGYCNLWDQVRNDFENV